VDEQLHVFLILALHGRQWSASWPGHFTAPGARAHGTGGRVGPRASLDIMVNRKKFLLLPGIKPIIQPTA